MRPRTARALASTIALLLLPALLSRCSGTDLIRETFPARVEVSPPAAAVEVGGAVVFGATYYDSLGAPAPGTAFTWSSSEPLTASVDDAGRVTGHRAGQAGITARARDVASLPALLTVVAAPDQAATVTVEPGSASIEPGGTLQFGAVVRDVGGGVIPGAVVTWRSTAPGIAEIDAGGLARGIAPGRAGIIATASGVDSLPAVLDVLGGVRTGAFTGRPGGGYSVSGAATLARRDDGALVLSFAENFRSSSGPGLAVYLSPSNTVSGLSLRVLSLARTTGSQVYVIPGGVSLNAHDWVIIHCEPFNVTFGYARLLP